MDGTYLTLGISYRRGVDKCRHPNSRRNNSVEAFGREPIPVSRDSWPRLAHSWRVKMPLYVTQTWLCLAFLPRMAFSPQFSLDKVRLNLTLCYLTPGHCTPSSTRHTEMKRPSEFKSWLVLTVGLGMCQGNKKLPRLNATTRFPCRQCGCKTCGWLPMITWTPSVSSWLAINLCRLIGLK